MWTALFLTKIKYPMLRHTQLKQKFPYLNIMLLDFRISNRKIVILLTVFFLWSSQIFGKHLAAICMHIPLKMAAKCLVKNCKLNKLKKKKTQWV